MAANGNTNVPEGMAWGWRTMSSGEPFTDGRPEIEKGNDKVVIVLTDGANTYSRAGQRSGRQQVDLRRLRLHRPGLQRHGRTRLFMGTSGAIGQYDYSTSNYTNALTSR